MDRIPNSSYQFDGVIAEYIQGVTNNWLKVAPRANPAMLEMLRDRDRVPRRDILYFSGEFAGKYLTSAVQVLRLTHDQELRAFLQSFVDELVSIQAADGYLGPYPQEVQLTNRLPEGETNALNGQVWDTWGHYHLMLGLLLWYEDTRDAQALRAVRKMGDLLCDKFLNAPMGRRLVETGVRDPYGWTGTQMNLAPIHSLALLYKETRARSYLALAQQIADEFAAQGPDGPLAGDYIRTALAGQEFFETPRPRWESLHAIMGLAELYSITGCQDYRRAFEHIWWSICKLDRHNNGGFSTGEQAVGNPYASGAIETCCTIAWMALSVEMLRLTGDSIVADELELSLLNSVLGFYSRTGRWTTYNTPMDGERCGFVQDVNWQCRPGSPELNCCSVNAPRGLGILSNWALMQDADAVVLNYYGEGAMTARLPNGLKVMFRQETDYPRRGRVQLTVAPARAALFTVKLRIPQWSEETRVRVNGQRVSRVKPGSYLTLDRKWRKGDAVTLDFDMTTHFWVGERECHGKTSIYRGPILLAFDERYNDGLTCETTLDARALVGRLVGDKRWYPPIMLMEYPARDGRPVRLCDFASAGGTGTRYASWLNIAGVTPTEFSRSHPLRSGKPRAVNV